LPGSNVRSRVDCNGLAANEIDEAPVFVAAVAGALTTLLAEVERIVRAEASGESAGLEPCGVFQPLHGFLIRALALPLAGIEAVAICPD
jgi:hypothetical protein